MHIVFLLDEIYVPWFVSWVRFRSVSSDILSNNSKVLNNKGSYQDQAAERRENFSKGREREGDLNVGVVGSEIKFT